MMARRNVTKVTVEFEDGKTETHAVEGMFYKVSSNFPGGAWPREDDRYFSHEIHWVVPKESPNCPIN
jgi:hypothetical protein